MRSIYKSVAGGGLVGWVWRFVLPAVDASLFMKINN